MMRKGSGRHTGKGGKMQGGIGRDDFQLWKDFTRDIEPLEEPDWATMESLVRDAAQQSPEMEAALPLEHKQSAPLSPADKTQASIAPPQLDGRTDARLRRGQMPIEARIDLHGNTQDEAHGRLNDFVLRAQSQGKRCVLVITGKGSSRRMTEYGEERSGVLRQKLPLWLSMAPLRGLVLKCYPAVQRDGGTGAWYLYLKRNRDY